MSWHGAGVRHAWGGDGECLCVMGVGERCVAWGERTALASPSCVVGALPVTHFCWRTCSAVMRFTGSMVRSLETSSLASFEMLSHHGDGKSYLACRIWSKSAGSSSS